MSNDSFAASQLRAFVERAERINAEKAALNADLSELFKEAKSKGFNVKVLKAIIADRAKDENEKSEFETLFDLYQSALGTAGYSRVHAHTRGGHNVDENGDGPIRRMAMRVDETFDTLEAEGRIQGRDENRWVYFVIADGAGLLKIGSSDRPEERFRGICGMSPLPLRLLGVIPGGLKLELELHAQFADRRKHGEWFEADEGFIGQISELIATRAPARRAA